MATKRCRECGEIKDATEFYKLTGGKKSPDGRRAQCIPCYSARRRINYQAAKSRITALFRAARARDGDRIRARDNLYYRANRERKLAQRRARYAADRERILAYNKAWREVPINREKLRPGRLMEFKKRKARLAGVESVIITQPMVAAMYDDQGGRCYYCRKALNGSYDMDHKTPICRGGPHTPENIVLACMTCNRRKHKKTEAEFVVGE